MTDKITIELTQEQLDKIKPLLEEAKPTHWRRWKPERDDWYYFISSTAGIDGFRNNCDEVARGLISLGNAFQTRKQAEKIRDRNKLIHELWQEDGALLKPDWGNSDRDKFSIYYDHGLRMWTQTEAYTMQEAFILPHFKTKESAQAIIEKYGDRLDLLLD
jgi:hypothetical protein